MKNLVKLTQFDKSLVRVPPIAVFFEFGEQLDVDQLYASVLRTLKLFPTFSAKFIYDGEFYLRYIPNYFGFKVFKSLEKNFFLSSHINTEIKDLCVLGVPNVIEQPVLNIFVTQKANGAQLTINLSHGVADGASLKLFVFQLFSFFKKKNIQIVPFCQKKIHLDESDEIIDTQSTIEKYSFRNGYFNEIIIPFAKVKNIYKEICLSNGTENLKLHDIVACLLLKSLAVQLSHNNENVNFIIPIDIRNLHRALNSYYVGNGFVEAFCSWNLKDLLSLDLIEMALKIRQGINKFSDSSFLNAKVTMAENGLSFEKFSENELHGFAYDKFVTLTSLGRGNSFLSISESEKIGILADNSYGITVFRIDLDYVVNITSPNRITNFNLLEG